MKAVVAAFNQEKALVGAFSVITNLQMDLFQALLCRFCAGAHHELGPAERVLAADHARPRLLCLHNHNCPLLAARATELRPAARAASYRKYVNGTFVN